jgi:hypothetical protein
MGWFGGNLSRRWRFSSRKRPEHSGIPAVSHPPAPGDPPCWRFESLLEKPGLEFRVYAVRAACDHPTA